MTEQQIPKLVAAFVEHQSAFSVLSSDDAQWAIQNTKQAIAICAEAIKNRPKPIERLLEFLGTIDILSPAEPFIAKEKFVVDISDEAEVKISYLGENFQKIFLNKIKSACGPLTLYYHKLLKGLVDDDIIDELGGKDVVEASLHGMFSVLKKQGCGQSGALLVNGYANIFYIRDDNDVLWAVYCYWSGDGWFVFANPVDDPNRWNAGSRVFSRNLSVPQG